MLNLQDFFMYDILQLNDMLVPELLDIAEQLNISNAKKLEKQELIYKILDKQAIMHDTKKSEGKYEKPKRKRIIKATTANYRRSSCRRSRPADKKAHKEVSSQKTAKKRKNPVKKAPKEDDDETMPMIHADEQSGTI